MALRDRLDDFKKNLPTRPYYWDSITNKAVWSDQRTALESCRIQFNPKHALYWVAVDVDHRYASLAWEECGLPPTLIIQNLEGRLGHAHLLYLLERPVIVGKGKENASAVRYYAAVRRGLTAALKGDRGYSNFMCKNPINASAHRFRVTSPRQQPYTLSEIARYVDTSIPVGQINGDEGRNCFTFTKVSKWAYHNCYRYSDRDAFLQAVLDQCNSVGLSFYEPLPQSEVRCTAESIVRFCWGRFTSPPRESVLGLDQSLSLNERQAIGAVYVNRSRTESTRHIIGLAKARLGESVTQTAVVELTGLSLSTVKRQWRESPVVDVMAMGE